VVDLARLRRDRLAKVQRAMAAQDLGAMVLTDIVNIRYCTGVAVTPVVAATGVLAVAVTCGLWWSYFRNARPSFEHALAEAQGSARSSLARDAFSVIHFPMLCGVIAMAVAVEEALGHAGEPLAASVRIALGVGALLFVGGTGAAVWRATGRAPVWRMVLVALAALAVFAISGPPWQALGLLLVALVAVPLAESRSQR